MSALLRAGVVFAAASLAPAQEVEQVFWGFDGRVVVDRFNPLSVRIVNATDRPFEGTVRLEKQPLAGGRVGATLVEPCYVAARSARWVQFYPFVAAAHEEWRVAVGRASTVLDAPTIAGPAVVYLDRREFGAIVPGGLRRFPAARFPPSVTATSGLAALVIDGVPDWDVARRRAFLDWLHAGGRVYLLRAAGEWPRFAGELAVLNGESDKQRYGGGFVVRLPYASFEVPDGTLPKPAPVKEPAVFEPVARSILQQLRVPVDPKHAWALILFVAVVYFAVIGPIHWFWSAKKLELRGSTLSFAGLVAGFGALMFFLGKRGYDEESVNHSIAYARPVDGGRLWLTRYADLFVTSGARYRVRYPGEFHLFSTAQQYEAVAGRIENGVDGEFAVDIPLFSSREVIHATTVDAAAPAARVVEWRGQLSELSVEIELDGIERALAIHRGYYAELRVHDRSLAGYGTGAPIQQLEATRQVYPYQNRGQFVPPVEQLILAQLGEGSWAKLRPFERDTIELFVLVKSPTELGLTTSDLGREDARLLYHLTLPIGDD